MKIPSHIRNFLKPNENGLEGENVLYRDGFLESDISPWLLSFFLPVLIGLAGIYSECLADDVGLFMSVVYDENGK